jgi:hypothetical protein
MKLTTWASKWGIPNAAIEDLKKSLGAGILEVIHCEQGKSEAAVTSIVRLEASKKNCRLWRNNRGAFKNEYGQWVHYGLANESGKMNDFIKSSDLIGIRPVKIRETMVGLTIGQFVSREIKKSDWTYTGTDAEKAQLKWLELITSLGGDACFATREGTL